jgi:hypothetical protein
MEALAALQPLLGPLKQTNKESDLRKALVALTYLRTALLTQRVYMVLVEEGSVRGQNGVKKSSCSLFLSEQTFGMKCGFKDNLRPAGESEKYR